MCLKDDMLYLAQIEYFFFAVIEPWEELNHVPKNYLQSTWGGAVDRTCQKNFLSVCHAGFVCNSFVKQTQNCFHLQNTKLRIRRKDIIKGSGRTLWLGGPSWRRRRVPPMYQYLYHQEGTHVTSSMTAHLVRLSLIFLVCLHTTLCLIFFFFYNIHNVLWEVGAP